MILSKSSLACLALVLPLIWLAPAAVVPFIPFIAYIYGKVTELALKIINVD